MDIKEKAAHKPVDNMSSQRNNRLMKLNHPKSHLRDNQAQEQGKTDTGLMNKVAI